MRDVKRLDGFYNYLKAVHKNCFPDWRFGQLIVNLQRWYGRDIFYLEEDDFLQLLDSFIKTFKKGDKNA